jgi:response regulator RpfG family c-di-GMP phosphodiesterase
MLKLLQKLTKSLSIKNIVILGVVVMGLVITGFGITMTYLSSTIKYDQNTLKHILKLESQNQNILNTIKDINYLDNQIMLSKNLQSLKSFESNLLEKQKYETFYDKKNSSDFLDKYNSKIEEITNLINIQIDLQKDIFSTKSTKLYFLNSIYEYRNNIDNYINVISSETENIYGIASLLSKRYYRKLQNSTLDGNILEISNFSNIMSLTKELDSSILKLPMLIYTIIDTDNVDKINTIEFNNLNQLISLFENSSLKIDDFKYLDNNFESSISIINLKFMKIKELITFLTTLKKQYLKENENLQKLIDSKELYNDKIFKELNALNTISNEIKLEILNHSDSISKKTTIIIIVVGFIFLTLLTLAAMILISRINIPLEFILKYIDSIATKKRDLSSKLPIVSNDEFGKLSKSFNKMTSTILNNITEIAHLNKEIIDTQKEVIFTMGAIGESRSKETGNHVKRVAEYSRVLALKYGLSSKEAELLKEASPMHDIGKVGIPDSILKKPAKLDEHEWEIMKTHAQLGYEMLKHSNRKILKAAAIVAKEHHEKWDGSGYPNGLKGEDIHIFGRITAIADVFDALGSERCYKKAWPLEEIKSFFQENKGSHFDPKLVDLFFENIDEFIFIKDKYKDVF